MCSFYWSHRLRPLQPVIRLQVLYPRSLSPPLLLALPHPHLLVRRSAQGSLPYAPADVSTGAPLRRTLWVSAVYFCLCGRAALVIVPIHRLRALSISVISKHSGVTMNLIPRWERWANRRDGWFQTAWEVSAQIPSSRPHPSHHYSLHRLHGQIALRELSGRLLWLLAPKELHRSLPNFFSSSHHASLCTKIWCHRVQNVSLGFQRSSPLTVPYLRRTSLLVSNISCHRTGWGLFWGKSQF